jgi:hypothetical protein
MAETEKQFDKRMKGYEDDIKNNRSDVMWVNAEEYAKGMKQDRGFYGHYMPKHFKSTNIINSHSRVK